jgi:hypothetical protein
MPRLHRTLSPESLSSSVDSLNLFPRPLTFSRTTAGQSSLVSPTPLGRHAPNVASPRDSFRRKFVDSRPVTRGKSPGLKRHTRLSTAFRRPGRRVKESETSPGSPYQVLERNPFSDRLGLARFGGINRRSSVTSLSTLRIPKSFRPNISRGGSSIYSRDTKGMSVLPSPGLVSEFSASFHSLPELGPRRATTFDENIFKDLDWNLQNINARHHVSPASVVETETCGGNVLPQTPTFPHRQPAPETPKIGTASSDTFGARIPVPNISIARSSDDVFGASSKIEAMKDVVVENGRVFKRVRAMESKLSNEDLARYGGRTAPGGVEWF